jgi:hypothetical protein
MGGLVCPDALLPLAFRQALGQIDGRLPLALRCWSTLGASGRFFM